MTSISVYMTKRQSHLFPFFKEVSCFILNSEVPLEDTGKTASICQTALLLNVIFLFRSRRMQMGGPGTNFHLQEVLVFIR